MMGDAETVDSKRIHFLTNVEDLGAAYRCEKCGHETATKTEMYWHRKGLISRCFRARLKQRWRAVGTKTGREDDPDE